MNHELAIDADSILYKSIWRVKDNFDLEVAYLDFCGEICKIRSAVFEKFPYEKGDTINYEIVFTEGSNFRYDIFPQYKANRTDKMEGIDDLKNLIKSRLPNIVIPTNAEADDYVISRNCLVAAIDKDVLKACQYYSYNYNKNVWLEPNEPSDIEEWYLFQALMGDSTDGIPGAPGIGKVKAAPIAKSLVNGSIDWENYCAFFEYPYMATICNQLVRMNQWDHKTEQLALWTPDLLTVYDPDDI